jgi:hypothetical protein
VSGPRFGSCRGFPGAAALALLIGAGPGLAQSDGVDLRNAEPTPSEHSIVQAAWARGLVDHLGLSAALDDHPSDAERFGLLCPDDAEFVSEAGGRRAPSEAFVVVAELSGRGPGEHVRQIVSVPATALYQLEVEGVGTQRWVIDGRPVGHLDLSTLGVAHAPVILPLRAGAHEISGTMLPAARADRVRLAAWRTLCIAPAGGWKGGRTLTWGEWARTIVRAFGLDSRLPEEDADEQVIEGERFQSASEGGGRTTRRLSERASGDAWAMATTGPAEFTWELRLETPRVVTLVARTHGSAAQIWSVDGRYRITVEPTSGRGSFTWSRVATLPLQAGEHVLRARVARGTGVDAVRVIHHRSTDADHLRLVQQLGLPVGAPDSPVPRAVAQNSLRRPLVLELAAGLRRRLDGSRSIEEPVVLAEGASEPDFAGPRPLSPVLPSEL